MGEIPSISRIHTAYIGQSLHLDGTNEMFGEFLPLNNAGEGRLDPASFRVSAFPLQGQFDQFQGVQDPHNIGMSLETTGMSMVLSK